MKTRSLILIFVFGINSLSLSAQVLTSVSQTISKDTFVATLQNSSISSKTVNASSLPAGMYLYTLVVDNQIVDTKRMILTK